MVSKGIAGFCFTISLFFLFFKTIEVDEYGTQQPIALLKLLLEKGFLYDRGKELNCKSIRDLGFIAAMGKAGGGRNEVDPRFTSLFSVFNIPFPSEESLHLIYSSILKGHTSVTFFFFFFTYTRIYSFFFLLFKKNFLDSCIFDHAGFSSLHAGFL